MSEDHLSTVVAHRRQEGQTVRDPREGVFRLRRTLPKDGAVSVATAIDVVPAGSGRWFAWTQDGKLTASVGWGNHEIVSTPPITAEGTLLRPGFQVAVGTGLFGMVSANGGLATYIASSSGLRLHWSADLRGARGRVRWNAQPDGSMTVAWEEAGSGRIMRQSFNAQGHPIDSTPEAITSGRPTAWGLPAYGAPVVWVLDADSQVCVLTSRLKGSAPGFCVCLS